MNLQFITAATPYIGRGHVYRTIALAKEMERRGHRSIISVMPNTLGVDIVLAHCGSQDFFFYGEDYRILDIPGPHHYLDRVHRVVYLDWTGDERYDGAAVRDCTLKVCQGIATGYSSEKLPGKLVAGFDHVILWPDVVGYWGTVRKEQIFFYSSQQSTLTERVLDLLKNTNIPIVQPQPGTERVTGLLASSAIAVTFGGMTCLEACCLGIPQVAICTGPKQELQINALANLGAVLGISDKSLEFLPYLTRFLLNSWQSTGKTYTDMSKAGMECIDGKGVYRVADAIESLV